MGKQQRCGRLCAISLRFNRFFKSIQEPKEEHIRVKLDHRIKPPKNIQTEEHSFPIGPVMPQYHLEHPYGQVYAGQQEDIKDVPVQQAGVLLHACHFCHRVR